MSDTSLLTVQQARSLYNDNRDRIEDLTSFVFTFTPDSEKSTSEQLVVTCDKTIQEIRAAYLQGKKLKARLVSAQNMSESMQTVEFDETSSIMVQTLTQGEASGFYIYSGFINQFGNNIIIIYALESVPSEENSYLETQTDQLISKYQFDRLEARVKALEDKA